MIKPKYYMKINAYKTVLKKGIKALSNEERFEKIINKIRNLNDKELDNLLEMIEDAISH